MQHDALMLNKPLIELLPHINTKVCYLVEDSCQASILDLVPQETRQETPGKEW